MNRPRGETFRDGGRTYITMSAFARKVGVTPAAIRKMMRSGKLPSHKVSNYDGDFLDLEEAGVAFEAHRKTSRQLRGRPAPAGAMPPAPLVRDVPPVSDETEIGGMDISAIEALVDESGVRSSSFLKDCFTEKGKLDYNRLDVKAKAMLHVVQYFQQSGALVPAKDVYQTLNLVFTPLMKSLSELPTSMLGRMVSVIEEQEGITLSPRSKNLIRDAMRKQVEAMSARFRDDVDKALSDAGEPALPAEGTDA